MLEFCKRDGHQELTQIARLPNLGSDVQACDYSGNSCLHLYIANSIASGSSEEREALVLLVNAGADVYAVNGDGESVSDVAYTYDYNYNDSGWELGSYRGDLWDLVLFFCGLNPTQFRKGFPREPLYTRNYTRRHYQLLMEPEPWDECEFEDSEEDEKEYFSEEGSDEEDQRDEREESELRSELEQEGGQDMTESTIWILDPALKVSLLWKTTKTTTLTNSRTT